MKLYNNQNDKEGRKLHVILRYLQRNKRKIFHNAAMCKSSNCIIENLLEVYLDQMKLCYNTSICKVTKSKIKTYSESYFEYTKLSHNAFM